jgi:RsiW-degrading membrane proteinase PrsW (M82 family)
MSFENIGYSLLIGIIPSMIWLYFWLKEDKIHPEPRSLITYAFLLGCFAIIPSAIFEANIASLNLDDVHKYMYWAAIEEIVKFTLLALFIIPKKDVDEPIDGMIYAITLALGFAAIENTLFVFNHLSTETLSSGILTGSMRFIGASLVHVISSAFVGFGFGLMFYRKHILRTFVTALGLASLAQTIPNNKL